MNDEMLTEKTKTAINSFFNLNGNTYRKKKISLNIFFKTLQSEYSYEEVQDFINNLTSTTEYDRSLKTEIIIHFQLESSILETLKLGDEVAIGKVLKNWRFFENMFNKMTIDDFVDNFLPQLSYKTSIKVIKIIGKNINNNPLLADKLFNKLEEKCSIRIATLLIHSCSLNLIKDKCSKYGIHLSCQCLLLIYKKHPEFLKYYFDMMEKKHKHVSFSNYNQIFKYIARTNLKLFWELYDNYQFDIKVGRRRAIKLLPTQEIMLKYGFKNVSLFKGKHILKAARKFNLHKELILKSYPNNISDYIRDINSNNSPIIYMPRKAIFPLLQELFTKMYKDDFQNYVSLMNGKFLKYVTIKEREYILDKMSDKENFLHYYPISRSIPILKEKLKSANDPNTRLKLISSLFQTCNVNNDAKTLLDVLKLVYNRYKNETKVLSQFMLDIKLKWNDYSRFTEEHWETIYNLIEYLEYTADGVGINDFFERHFVWLVDNNKSYENLLDKIMKKCIIQYYITPCYYFKKSLKHMKIFINEIHNRLLGKDYNTLSSDLLNKVVYFDERFPNEINVWDYAYILEYSEKCIMFNTQYYNNTLYFIKNYNKDNFFNKYIKNLNKPYNVQLGIILYCIENCPEELDNFDNFHKKTQGINKKIRNFLLCPYFVKKHLQVYNKLSAEQLQDTEKDIETVLLNFFSYDKKFIDVVSNFLPPKDGKIKSKTDKIYVKKQKEIIKYIPQISTPGNMKLIRMFCKDDYLKYALRSLYKIAYKIPQNLLPEFLQNIYEDEASVKKHALYLGRFLLPVSSYYDFLLAATQLETNLSIRNILSKKIIEYLIENVDEKFFNLFIVNLKNVDKKDKDFYDYLIDYSKIPQEYKAKYITTIYDNIINNEEQNIRYKGFSLMENLPDYIIDELSVNLMKRYIETVDVSTTNFINKCLFHTTGQKHSEIFEFIINLITKLLKKYTLTNITVRTKATMLIIKIIDEARSYNNIKIIEKLRTILKPNFQQHALITIRLLLELSIIFLKSYKDPRIFSKNIKHHLFETIETYSFNMIKFYTKKLRLIIDPKHFDIVLFIQNLFNEGNENEIVYFVVIGLLPSTLPTEKNSFANYVPILEKLKLNGDPRIVAELDLYFQSIC